MTTALRAWEIGVTPIPARLRFSMRPSRNTLRQAMSEPPPDGGVWTGRKVARWMAGHLGRLVFPQRGVEYLRRLELTRQVPRPCNPEHSLYEQEMFKKNS